MNLKAFLCVVFLCSVNFSRSDGARILGLFTSPSKSHLIVHTAAIKGLAGRGHDVTVVTSLPVNDPVPEFRYIQLNTPGIPREFAKKQLYKDQSNLVKFLQLRIFTQLIFDIGNASLYEPQMQKLMREESFDLVILGYFFNDFQLGVAAHFKCPVIVNWMTRPIGLINQMVGNPTEISTVPHLFFGLRQPMDFKERFLNFFASILDVIQFSFMESQLNTYYLEHFPPDKYPSLEEMKKNVSLVLVNYHFSQTPIAPLVPAVVEIGGIQIKEKPNPLPKDLKTVLDGASKHGAIYFSLGSNAYTSDLAEDKIKMIYSVLSNMKQTVIWKWEEGEPPGKAANIIFKKWLPQDDILAHPNVKLFISHGGKGSVVESEYHGVPIVGLPLFAEQHTNLQEVELLGKGLTLDYHTLTRNDFKNAVEEVLSNSKYRETMQKFSKVFKDRPMSPQATATFWIEYVVRHHGAPHLQSPAVHMNLFQYYSLDVLAVIFIIMYLFIKFVKIVFRSICRLCSAKKQLKNKKE